MFGTDELAGLFDRKGHIYTARNLGVTGKEDTTVVTRAIEKKRPHCCRWTRIPMETLRLTWAALTWAYFSDFHFECGANPNGRRNC